jgi:hypothetical protein
VLCEICHLAISNSLIYSGGIGDYHKLGEGTANDCHSEGESMDDKDTCGVGLKVTDLELVDVLRSTSIDS